MNTLQLLRSKNKILGRLMPRKTAQQSVKLFLSPRTFPIKDWEYQAECEAKRVCFGPVHGHQLSALKWDGTGQRILLMHGWESRATQMSVIAESLSRQGYEVIAIDAPMHGNSGGSAANPVAFADAICAASEEFGPFSAAVGHSMGCVGLAIACDFGVEIPCYALIASPANMQETLQAFADFTCLPKQPAELFIRGVGEQVGRAAVELDVGDLLSQHQPNVLLLHSEDDLEVPFNAAETIQRKLPGTDIFRASGVGHRRIIRAPEVISVVSHFLLNSLEKVPGE